MEWVVRGECWEEERTFWRGLFALLKKNYPEKEF